MVMVTLCLAYKHALCKRSGSALECLTQAWEAAGLSLTGVVVLEQDTFILA